MGASRSRGSFDGRIFHIVPGAGPPMSAGGGVAREQFERHGFVHCCFREQLTEIATWWFEPGDDLVALEVDVGRLSAPLRLEASPTRWYPHVFGPIDADAIVDAHRLPRAKAGNRVVLPPPLASPPPGYRVTGLVEGEERSVTWQAGALIGDPVWRGRAHEAVAAGATVELIGGVVAPATLEAPYESFAVLAGATDDGGVRRYEGDGFFAAG